MKIKLFNTLTKQKEVFRPIDSREVRMYCCGPTVYQYAHIGNLRTYIFEDILRRVLEFNGYVVKHVTNVTDVGHLTSDADTGEDKIELSAQREKKSAWEIAEFYTKAFFEDTKKLNILRPTIVCKATEHIQDMIELIRKLEKKGYTYTTDDGIYYDTSKFADYGKLTGMSFERLKESLKAGARVEYSHQKRNITDFALWKFSPKDKKRQMEWKSPWGIGFPGWHIECAAMSMKYLGENFDVHCGGIDHIPIHHTNEIAEAEAATGKRFVNYWLHGAFLVLPKGLKMAKSKGNVITLKDLTDEGFDPLAFRYLCLTTHYRSELKFTVDGLRAAQNSLNTLRENMRIFAEDTSSRIRERAEEYRKKFLETVNDDLDTPRALAVLWEVVRSKDLNGREKYELVLDFDRVLGLDLGKEEKVELPPEVVELIKRRAMLRKIGDFKAADEVREKIRKEFGVLIEDTKEGIRWKKLNK